MNYRNQVVAVKMTKEEKNFLKLISFQNESPMGDIIRKCIKNNYSNFPLKEGSEK